eukprot:TRINITY_DN6847_c0_g1_i1.p1 TRINITY_DN6847_c0_g1~~TRINITY_DN6847_c0_g1_i1.p1  ORF type:complete len:576 (-),score=145.66 TRINITY_DN6847_c0_g1_i1:135-1814(-)
MTVRTVTMDVVHEMIENATSDMLMGPDWTTNTRLCDVMSANPIANVREALKSLKPRLKSNAVSVQLLSLELIDCLMKNCSHTRPVFQDKDWQAEFVKLATKSGSPEVRKKMLSMIREWSEELGGKKETHQYRSTYEQLYKQGVKFPPKGPAPPLAFSHPSAEVKTSSAATSRPKGRSREQFSQEISILRENIALLTEMLQSLDPVQEDVRQNETVAAVVTTIKSSQPNITSAIETMRDEAALAELLELNDSLVKVLELHQTALARRPYPAGALIAAAGSEPPDSVVQAVLDKHAAATLRPSEPVPLLMQPPQPIRPLYTQPLVPQPIQSPLPPAAWALQPQMTMATAQQFQPMAAQPMQPSASAMTIRPSEQPMMPPLQPQQLPQLLPLPGQPQGTQSPIHLPQAQLQPLQRLPMQLPQDYQQQPLSPYSSPYILQYTLPQAPAAAPYISPVPLNPSASPCSFPQYASTDTAAFSMGSAPVMSPAPAPALVDQFARLAQRQPSAAHMSLPMPADVMPQLPQPVVLAPPSPVPPNPFEALAARRLSQPPPASSGTPTQFV